MFLGVQRRGLGRSGGGLQEWAGTEGVWERAPGLGWERGVQKLRPPPVRHDKRRHQRRVVCAEISGLERSKTMGPQGPVEVGGVPPWTGGSSSAPSGLAARKMSWGKASDGPLHQARRRLVCTLVPCGPLHQDQRRLVHTAASYGL